MAGLHDTSNVYDAGTEFNYTVWAANTTITLANVPWNNDYRDIVNFGNQAALDTWLNNQPTTSVTLQNITLAKFGQPVTLDIPFGAALRFNYLRAQNPVQPIPGGSIAQSYYYFITDVQYLAPNATRFVLQLDVWQTFGYQITFGNCYIERGHIGIANQNAFDAYGRDYLTIPEGMDIGSEYRTIYANSRIVMDANYMNIMVVSAVELETDPGTTDAPVLRAAVGDNVQGLPSGASVYFFNTVGDFTRFMQTYSAYPWVTQGILSITAIPPLSRYNYLTVPSATTLGVTLLSFPAGQYDNERVVEAATNWRQNPSITGWIPSRYQMLQKFFTYPYMIIEMTAFNGPPTILKPESWQDPHATYSEKISLLPPNQRIVAYPQKYNTANPLWIPEQGQKSNVQQVQQYDDWGDYLDTQIQISNFPQFSVVNNNATLYLANNAHAIGQMYHQSDWSQQKALAGNQTSYDQATQALNNAQQNALVGRNAAIYSTQQANRVAGQRAVAGGIGAGANGLLDAAGGNPAMAAGGAAASILGDVLNYGIEVHNNNAQLAIANSANVATTRNNATTSAFMRDTNKNLADWSARGDYAQSIANINAKVQDSRMAQPSTSGQVGGEAFNVINGGQRISIRWKLINTAEMRAVGEYWLRYGYAVQQFASMPASLMVMTNFTYWKLQETYITAFRGPEQFKQAIRGIFEKGVTVWTDPSKIGTIDIADNQPLTGVTLAFDTVTPPPITFPTKSGFDMPIIINHVINNVNNFYTIAPEYCRLMNNEGITVPTEMMGPDIVMNDAEVASAFLVFGIPQEYADPTTFLASWPNGTWSKALELELYMQSLQPKQRTVTDGVTTASSTTVTSATANFTANDVNATITGGSIPSNTTITSVTNATTVILSQAPTASATAVSFTITDVVVPAATTAN